MANFNNRKINNFRIEEEDSMRNIYKIKKDFIAKNNVELIKYIEGLEAISNIIELDELMIFTGILYSIRDYIMEEELNDKNFYIEFEDGLKMKLPLFMKKGLGTPYYYLDLGKTNTEIYKKTKEKLIEENIEVDLSRFDKVFELTTYRKINISQQTFLAGYVLGFKYRNNEITFEKFYEVIKKCYKSLHKKHK